MNIGIIGAGLMGGSLARRLKKTCEHKVFLADVNAAAIRKAALLGAFDEQLSIGNAAKLDMLVIATYPDAVGDILTAYLPHLKRGAIVTDFCGIKSKIVGLMKEFAKVYPDIVFVGGHPMAGREFSGIEHSAINLFDRASMILVNVNADVFALDEMRKFYLSIGFSKVVFTTAENHDLMIAYTSQLCHIVSNAFIKNEAASLHDGYSAGSYRDLTRVARLDPDMWASLMTDNRDMLYRQLQELICNLEKYADALKRGDKAALRSLLAEGNDRKMEIDVKTTRSEE